MGITEIKEFLRLEQDYTEEDMFLNALIQASEGYIYNATGLNGTDITDANQIELYKLAQKLLITHWYENREAISEKKTDKIAFSLNSILVQLQYCYEGDTV
ncbi:phage gp6-like head-tail connector protein [Clostridium tepidiprofundi DSM 19306]|uniref:Phage gp6-like head-tail connector protein n=1 Tax=Clostridium tepidiprofundi DSM 19306 TaxID=1121338 RepID=A0A151B859_9CLOT|nr:head-tail connector protein [Clostridium tepidiprofundi]KYH35837.1 phage gp6-like head-tail connector protein [Clostridium tepidiprofundi DSM 19306]